jgi:adenylate cyclase
VSYKLVSTEGTQQVELREDAPMIIGRALGCDVPLPDATISRRHAEVASNGEEVWVRDLGSSNGTAVNGQRVEEATIHAGDLISFGDVAFRLVESIAEPQDEDSTQSRTTAPSREPNVTRQALPPYVPGALPNDARWPSDTASKPQDLSARKLALLLEVARALGGTTDTGALLEKIADFLFHIMDVDRVAILLADDAGELQPRVSRDRWGEVAGAVPQSIARTVQQERVAILSDNVPEDERFTGDSILAQKVRAAMCAPLAGSEETVHGVLYVDNLSTTHRFNAADLDFLVAFSAIAAIAIEHSAYARRIQQQAIVRSNFERYFAPEIAARIAREPGAVRLGGDRRRVVVLFSDIRGFTALSERMRPDDTASLLSEYFSAMVECVFRHGGMVDKFIGDALLAQWGAPIEETDDSDRAVAAALDMLRELSALNERWAAVGRPALQVGMGIDRGEVFAGNIGSERRLEFTVIGDAVNRAWQLCACASGGEILLTDEVLGSLERPGISAEPGEPIPVKGNGQRISVHRLVP